eukprot:gene12141-14205_t
MSGGISKKTQERIRTKRDEEARVKKSEAEQRFIEANKVPIDDLTFDETVQNLKDKLAKYHVVYATHMTLLFAKVETMEQLEQALLFYKSVRNDDASYFNPDQVSRIYYAFDRTNAWSLWADVLNHAHTFQIFVTQTVASKTIYQLLRVGDTERAIRLIDTMRTRAPLTKSFMPNVARGLERTGQVAAIYPILNHVATLGEPIDGQVIRCIIRDAINRGEPAAAIQAIDQFKETIKFDRVGKTLLTTAKLLTGVSDDAVMQEFRTNEEFVAKNLVSRLDSKEFTPAGLALFQSAIPSFFGSAIPQSLSTILTTAAAATPETTEESSDVAAEESSSPAVEEESKQ